MPLWSWYAWGAFYRLQKQMGKTQQQREVITHPPTSACSIQAHYMGVHLQIQRDKNTKVSTLLFNRNFTRFYIYIYNPLNMGPKFQAKRERATHGHGDQQLHLPKGDFFPLFHHTSCKLVVLLWIYDGFTFSGAWSNEMLLSKCQLKQIYSRGRTDVNRHESNMLHRMFMQL